MATRDRGLVEVITVGRKERILHPVVLEALSLNGGGLNVVGSRSQAVQLLKLRALSPWGVAATVELVCTSGVVAIGARGRGISVHGKKILVPCLEGTPTLEFEFALDPARSATPRRLTDPSDNRIHVQLDLQYTDAEGGRIKAVSSKVVTMSRE